MFNLKRLPADFNPDDYLFLNPDVRKAGADPAQHYLDHGRAEGRPYKRVGVSLRPKLDSPYDFDGLQTAHNHDFMEESAFKDAYQRGMRAAGADYQIYWRLHIALWAARTSIHVEGDFIECGVNKGFVSSAIMLDLNWNDVGRRFYLLDTFAGIDDRFVSDVEKDAGSLDRNQKNLESGFYTKSVDSVRQNFAEWRDAVIVQGAIPETLPEIKSDRVAFLHLDMNCSPPEIAALEYIWPKMSPGGVVLLDDYAYYGYQTQKDAFDDWSRRNGAPIAGLPTGQGLIIKH